jgi:glucokinase
MHENLISAALSKAPVCLLNDLEATVWGTFHLNESQMETLQAGSRIPGQGAIAVIAAGTGLGEAGLVRTETGWHAVASEGGHTDFGPGDEEQTALLQFLRREFGHVSYERVVSGPGLHNIYRFLLSRGGEPEPGRLQERMRNEDPSAVIAEAGLTKRDARCAHALEIFAAVYGAEAANLALKYLALGGVYVCGGIAPKILAALKTGGFMESFLDKGRFRSMLEQIPVRVCLNPDAALIGAAHIAANLK